MWIGYAAEQTVLPALHLIVPAFRLNNTPSWREALPNLTGTSPTLTTLVRSCQYIMLHLTSHVHDIVIANSALISTSHISRSLIALGGVEYDIYNDEIGMERGLRPTSL
jgi:hypothetical protein